MITNLSSQRRKLPIRAILIVALLIFIGLGAFWIFGRASKPAAVEYPLYLNFAGGYVFSVPNEYSVDEQSVPGIQLVYSGTFTVKTLADIYDVGGISVQALTEFNKDTKFSEFVDKTFVPNLKKDLASDDVQVKFSNERGEDAARIMAKKDGKAFRFIYLRGGEHPVALVANDENDTLKKISQTVVNVEESALKDEAEPAKQAIKSAVENLQADKVDELYAAAAPELQSRSTKEQVQQALKDASDYVHGNIVIAGGSINDTQGFSVALRFIKLDDKEGKEPAFGSLAIKKVDGQWKLEMLGLPSPKQE